MTIKIFFKYTTIYREVMHTPKFDFCQFMKMGTTNLMIKHLLAVVNSTDLVHECPYEVHIDGFQNAPEITNNPSFQSIRMRDFVPRVETMASVIPSGDYLLQYNFTTNNEPLLFARCYLTMNTSDKHNFG